MISPEQVSPVLFDSRDPLYRDPVGAVTAGTVVQLTFLIHRGVCPRRIIVFFDGTVPVTMLNPVITAQSEPYEAEEGCLSLSGTRTAKRWRTITVEFQTTAFQKQRKTYSGWTAQIIQHEIDHCNGILI